MRLRSHIIDIPPRLARSAMVLPLVALSGLGVGLANVALADSGNLVVNPGFEQGTTGWKSISPGSVSLGTGRTGNAGTLTNAGSATATVALNDTVNTVGSTVKGQNYVAGAWIRTTVVSRSVSVRMMEYAGSTFEGKAMGTATLADTAWHYVSVAYTAVTTGASIDLNVLGSQMPAGGSVLVDDVSLINQSTPTADTTPPTAPPNLSPGAATTQSVALTWGAASDNVGVTGYKIVRNGTVLPGTVAGLSFTDSGLASSTAYTYTVRAVDAAGNTSVDSPSAAGTTTAQPDTSAPTAPPTLSAGSATSQSLVLTWGAASDNVGVAGYRVVRNGTFLPGTVSGLSYTDTGLASSTAYTYTVRAVDAAGNTSPDSQAATITTAASTFVQGWGTPTWSDEFNATAVDSTKWNTRNNDYLSYDLACIYAKNVTEGNGYLTIASKREAGCNSRAYTTGYLDTIGLKSWTSGRFEMRAKLPVAKNLSKGMWPAWWMRPNDGGAGEIDMMEAYGTGADGSGGDGHEFGQTTTTLWGAYGSGLKAGKMYQTGADLSAGFHVWAFEWEPGVMRFYVDGTLTFTQSSATTSWYSSVFDQGRPFNFRLDTQVGGSWAGTPESTNVFPANYVVDYVRVYQR